MVRGSNDLVADAVPTGNPLTCLKRQDRVFAPNDNIG